MKNLLAVIGDGNAGPVLEAALMVARRFNSHIVGLHSLTTEYAVVFGGEMGFSISSEVDRTLEREGHERRDQARRLFRDFMNAQRRADRPPAPGYVGPSASWREEDGRQNAIVGMTGRVYDLILVEQPEKLASIAEATLEDALFESGRPVMMVPKAVGPQLGETSRSPGTAAPKRRLTVALAMPFLQAGQAGRGRRLSVHNICPSPVPPARNWPRPGGPRAQRFDAHRGRAAEAAGRIVYEGGDGGGRRPDAEGRLHAKPYPPDDLWRRHAAYHYGITHSGDHVALGQGTRCLFRPAATSGGNGLLAAGVDRL